MTRSQRTITESGFDISPQCVEPDTLLSPDEPDGCSSNERRLMGLLRGVRSQIEQYGEYPRLLEREESLERRLHEVQDEEAEELALLLRKQQPSDERLEQAWNHINQLLREHGYPSISD